MCKHNSIGQRGEDDTDSANLNQGAYFKDGLPTHVVHGGKKSETWIYLDSRGARLFLGADRLADTCHRMRAVQSRRQQRVQTHGQCGPAVSKAIARVAVDSLLRERGTRCKSPLLSAQRHQLGWHVTQYHNMIPIVARVLKYENIGTK